MAVWAETLTMLRRLTDAGFMVNVVKCKFLVLQMKMLGNVIFADCQKPVFTLLKVLVEAERKPATVGDVRRIYGLLSLYR